MLFRTFIAFCICANLSLSDCTTVHALSYLEYLATNKVSSNMLANHVSAIKAYFTMLDLNYVIWEHPNIRYFQKSIRINRPLAIASRNIIDLLTLASMVDICNTLYMGTVYKTVFLLAFFGFLSLSNIAPHSISDFDVTRHLTAGDLIFTKKYLKVILKWSKTLQTHNEVHLLTLPRVKTSSLCPYRACRQALQLYSPTNDQPLFQFKSILGWVPLTDTRIRKMLAKINVKLGLAPSHFSCLLKVWCHPSI